MNTATIKIRQQRHADRCAARASQIKTLADGTLVVPSVSNDPNADVAAWARHLGIDLSSSVMLIQQGEPGRCWVKHAGQTSVTSHG